MSVFPVDPSHAYTLQHHIESILKTAFTAFLKNFLDELKGRKDDNDRERAEKIDPDNKTFPEIRWKIARDGRPLYDSGADSLKMPESGTRSSDGAIDVEWVEAFSRAVSTDDPVAREPDLANTTVEASVTENGQEVERYRIIIVDENGEIYNLFKGDAPDNRRKASEITGDDPDNRRDASEITGDDPDNQRDASENAAVISGGVEYGRENPLIAESNAELPFKIAFNTEMDEILDTFRSPGDEGAIVEVYRDGKAIYSELQNIDETNGRLMGQLEILRSLPVATLAGERATHLQVVSVRGEERETIFETDGNGRVVVNRPYIPEGYTAGLDVVSEYFQASPEAIAGYLLQLSGEMKQTRETVQRLSEDNEKLFQLLNARQREENLRVTDWWQNLSSLPKRWGEAVESRKAAGTVLEIFRRETFPNATWYEGSEYTIAREGNLYTLSDRGGKEYLKFEVTPANRLKIASATLDPELLNRLAAARKAMRAGEDLPVPLATAGVLTESRARRAAAIVKSLLAIAAAQPGGSFELRGTNRFNIAVDSNTGKVSLYSIADDRGEVFRHSPERDGTVTLNRMTEDEMKFIEGRIAHFEREWDASRERSNRTVDTPTVSSEGQRRRGR